MTDTSTTTVPDGLTLCTNWYGTTAHYAETASLVAYHDGHEGKPLCRGAGAPDAVFDQTIENGHARKAKNIVELPLCKRCVRAAAKREVSAR